MKIFTITHKRFTPPQNPLYVPLHVGHERFVREGIEDYGYMGDDTGDHISGKNNLYGELTGLYWVWKNCPDLDYAGLVHYRRYFAGAQGKLLTAQDFKRLFDRYDVIIGQHITYEESYEDKFAQYHHRADLEKTGAVIKALCPDYYETFQEVIRGKEQYVFNLFAAPKKLWDAYAKWLFDICFALEEQIDVSGYDQYRARIYGFLAEELLYVWIKKNKLSYYEAPVIYSQEKAETIEFKQAVRQRIVSDGYEAAYHLFLDTFQKRPDLTLEDADFNQELRILLAQLTHAVRFPQEAPKNRYYAAQLERFMAADRILDSFSRQPAGHKAGQEALKQLSDSGITENMLRCLIETHADYKSREENLFKAMLPGGTACDFDSYMKRLRAVEPVSVIILRCGQDEQTDCAVAESVESVLKQKDCTVEVLIADAAGGFLDAGGNIPAVGVDISSGIYENMAQVKNAAIRTASYDQVLLLPAGAVLADGELFRIMAGSDVLAPQCFDRLMQLGEQGFGRMAVSRRQLLISGGWNETLPAGEDYELLLRACDGGCSGGYRISLHGADKAVYRETYQTYGYVLAKYVRLLKEKGMFDAVFSARYSEAAAYGIQDYFVAQTERLMTQKSVFEQMDWNTRPILIVMGEGLCYGVLDRFAEGFTAALRRCGRCVRVLDMRQEGNTLEQAAVRQQYRAVVGFQTGAFAKQLPNGDLAGNLFDCPKFNFIFDHPLYISYYLMMPVRDFYVLAQDADYAAYVKRYIPGVRGVWHLPPAGEQGTLSQTAEKSGLSPAAGVEKRYGLTFIGTYYNYRERLREIDRLPSPDKDLAVRLLRRMKNNPDLPIEQAYEAVLAETGCGSKERDFAVGLHRLREAGLAVMFYYREKVVRELLAAGIQLHVFSGSWKDSPLAGSPNLVIHDNVSYKESLDIMAQSRLTLNLMSWHKNGMTERIANAMLNGAVCISDKTGYLKQHFHDGENIVLFDLSDTASAAKRIAFLLDPENDGAVQAIAEAGYVAAQRGHCWDNRAQQFLALLRETQNRHWEREEKDA